MWDELDSKYDRRLRSERWRTRIRARVSWEKDRQAIIKFLNRSLFWSPADDQEMRRALEQHDQEERRKKKFTPSSCGRRHSGPSGMRVDDQSADEPIQSSDQEEIYLSDPDVQFAGADDSDEEYEGDACFLNALVHQKHYSVEMTVTQEDSDGEEHTLGAHRYHFRHNLQDIDDEDADDQVQESDPVRSSYSDSGSSYSDSGAEEGTRG